MLGPYEWGQHYLLVQLLTGGNSTAWLLDHVEQHVFLEFVTKNVSSNITGFQAQMLTEDSFDVLEEIYRAKERFLEGD